jgi:hypothetical protein
MEAKKACLAKSAPTTEGRANGPTEDDRLFETDEDSEADSGDYTDWEDVVPSGSSPKIDEKAVFARVDSKRDLASAKSLLTAMLSGSAASAPVEIGGLKKQASKARYRSPDQKALSPRSTRRNMLASELSVSLRQHLLWERRQRINRVTLPPQSAQGPQRQGVPGITVKERSNSF